MIPTIAELEKNIGCRLYKTAEISQMVGILRSKFQNFESAGFLNEFCFELGKDYIAPKVKRKPKRLYPESDLEKLKAFFNNYDQRMHELNSNDQLTQDHFIARSLGYTTDEFLQEIEEGLWDEHIVTKTWSYRAKRIVYYFKKDCIKHSKYVSLSRLPEFIDVHHTTVFSYVYQGLLVQPEHLKGTNKWDIEKAKQDIAEIKIENLNKCKVKTADYFSLLSDAQQKHINNYLKKRKKGSPIVWESNEYYGHAAGERDKDRERIRYYLSKYLIKMISSKEMEEEKIVSLLPSQDNDINAFNSVSEEDIEIVRRKASKFDLFELKQGDIDLIMDGYKPNSEWTAAETLRPFIYYLLSDWESKFPGWQIAEDRNYSMEYFKTRTELFNAVNSLIRKKPNTPKKDKREKIYLTRQEIIKVYQAIRDMGRKRVPMKNWRRNAVMWMIGAFAAVRPEEISELRIEHFDLDENGFLKKINSLGYGLLWIPDEISKGVYSPSHPDYGTLLVPNLVELINEYLEKDIYTHSDVRGQGYLFRMRFTRQDLEAKIEQPMNWINDCKWDFSFLSSEKIKSFQFKSSRHTLNNLFDKTGIPNSDLNGAKKRAGQIQMRHNIRKKTGTIGDVYYTDEIPLEHYVRCVDEILNFPWNLEDLTVWETAKGYVGLSNGQSGQNPYEVFSDTNSKPEVPSEVPTSIDKQILSRAILEKEAAIDDIEVAKRRYEELDQEFNHYLRTSFKKLGITFQERQSKLNELETELKILKSKIS